MINRSKYTIFIQQNFHDILMFYLSVNNTNFINFNYYKTSIILGRKPILYHLVLCHKKIVKNAGL